MEDKYPKKIIVTDVKISESEMHVNRLRKTIVLYGFEDMEASDGSHTFDELYRHRYQLFIVICQLLLNDGGVGPKPWRSKLHADGTMYDDYFLLGINQKAGEQISYHLPMEYWDKTEGIEWIDNAPEWDGHTPQDVLDRLEKLV